MSGIFTDPGGWFLEVPVSGVWGVNRVGLKVLHPPHPQYHHLCFYFFKIFIGV